MTDTQPLMRQRGARLLLAGTALAGLGAAIGLTGFVLGTVAVIAVARDRVVRMDVPPKELAKRQWRQARAAVSAGTSAWREQTANPRVG